MQSDTKSFIVRIWVESGSDQEQSPTWRGVVEQVGHPKRLYFQDLDQAFQFVKEQAGIGGNMKSVFFPPALRWATGWWKNLVKRFTHANHLPRHAQDDEPQEPHRD